MLSRHAHPARQAGTQASADWQKGATCITCEMRGALHASGVCRPRIAPLNFQRHSWRDILLIWWVQRRFIDVRRRHEPNVGQLKRGALAKFPEVLLFAGRGATHSHSHSSDARMPTRALTFFAKGGVSPTVTG
eukprot:COSAG01_NODE_29629_length_633_cov_1.168539_1_plen_133_part_01